MPRRAEVVRGVSPMIPGHEEKLEKINLVHSIPFFTIHLGCLFVLVFGFSWIALGMCILLYLVRMFAITGGYHRYFSHRSYRTSRWFQFLIALVGTASVQKGPLWWAAHHRHHHRHSDTEEDIHSPVLRGIWWAHLGWIVCDRYLGLRKENVRDFLKFPELRFIDRYHLIAPLSLMGALYCFGEILESSFPQLHTSGPQMLVWGFCISTTILYHATFSINSVAHLVGTVRYETGDTSRNNFWLALFTLGEGWHNNHHRFPGAERQGFYWWEVDITHYILKFLSWFGIVWDLREPPRKIL